MFEMTDDRSKPLRPIAVLTCVALVSLLSACAPAAEESAEQPEATDAEEHAGHDMEGSGDVRVFFVEPKDGDTVTSPVKMVFGAENFVIEPVGDGAINEGAGHYHVGVNAECFEPGIVIPQGEPSWIHFGDGSAEIEMQLPPGPATLCLQIGDGEHRTLEGAGMEDVITVEVVEAEQSATGDS